MPDGDGGLGVGHDGQREVDRDPGVRHGDGDFPELFGGIVAHGKALGALGRGAVGKGDKQADLRFVDLFTLHHRFGRGDDLNGGHRLPLDDDEPQMAVPGVGFGGAPLVPVQDDLFVQIRILKAQSVVQDVEVLQPAVVVEHSVRQRSDLLAEREARASGVNVVDELCAVLGVDAAVNGLEPGIFRVHRNAVEHPAVGHGDVGGLHVFAVGNAFEHTEAGDGVRLQLRHAVRDGERADIDVAVDGVGVDDGGVGGDGESFREAQRKDEVFAVLLRGVQAVIIHRVNGVAGRDGQVLQRQAQISKRVGAEQRQRFGQDEGFHVAVGQRRSGPLGAEGGDGGARLKPHAVEIRGVSAPRTCRLALTENDGSRAAKIQQAVRHVHAPGDIPIDAGRIIGQALFSGLGKDVADALFLAHGVLGGAGLAGHNEIPRKGHARLIDHPAADKALEGFHIVQRDIGPVLGVDGGDHLGEDRLLRLAGDHSAVKAVIKPIEPAEGVPRLGVREAVKHGDGKRIRPVVDLFDREAQQRLAQIRHDGIALINLRQGRGQREFGGHAFYKSAVAEARQALGQDDLIQREAVGERHAADIPQGRREHGIGQHDTAEERAVPDGGEGGRERHVLQIRAEVKGVAADVRDPFADDKVLHADEFRDRVHGFHQFRGFGSVRNGADPRKGHGLGRFIPGPGGARVLGADDGQRHGRQQEQQTQKDRKGFSCDFHSLPPCSFVFMCKRHKRPLVPIKSNSGNECKRNGADDAFRGVNS